MAETGIQTHVEIVDRAVQVANPSAIAAVVAGVSLQVVVEHFLLSSTSQCGAGVSGDESFQSAPESQSDVAVDIVKGSEVTVSQRCARSLVGAGWACLRGSWMMMPRLRLSLRLPFRGWRPSVKLGRKRWTVCRSSAKVGTSLDPSSPAIMSSAVGAAVF